MSTTTRRPANGGKSDGIASGSGLENAILLVTASFAGRAGPGDIWACSVRPGRSDAIIQPWASAAQPAGTEAVPHAVWAFRLFAIQLPELPRQFIVQRTTRMRSPDMPITICNRFWYSSDQDVTVDDDGFLWLRRGELTQHINADVVNLAQLRNVACLALLGEPGSGKSTALGVERDAVLADGEAAVDVDLGSVASDESLARLVFRALGDCPGKSLPSLPGLLR